MRRTGVSHWSASLALSSGERCDAKWAVMPIVGYLSLVVVLLLWGSSGWASGFSGEDLEGRPCRGETKGYGPFDYNDPRNHKKHLPLVEEYHFTSEVEGLISGKSGSLLQDIDYTLRAFPNHHRALFSIIRYATRFSTSGRHAQEMTTKPECYLQRALLFRPEDGKVHMLFGLYLHKKGRLEEAETYYRKALELMPDNAEANYNLGLVLVHQEKYPNAVPMAKKAYKLGYPLQGLKNILAREGYSISP